MRIKMQVLDRSNYCIDFLCKKIKKIMANLEEDRTTCLPVTLLRSIFIIVQLLLAVTIVPTVRSPPFYFRSSSVLLFELVLFLLFASMCASHLKETGRSSPDCTSGTAR
jgi:hypothetical protein